MKTNSDKTKEQLLKDVERLNARVSELEESENKGKELFSATIESISDGFFILETENLVVKYFNQAAEELLGRKEEDVLEKPLFEAFPEAKGSIFEKQYQEAFNNKKFIAFETYFGEKPYVNWYDVRVYPGENIISVLFQIITEQKQAKETLLNSNSILTSIVESPDNVIMFALDTNYNYLGFNKAHEKEMKLIYDVDIERGKHILSYMPNEDDRAKAEQNYVRVLNGERFIEIQQYGLGEDRSWYELIFNPIISARDKVTGFTVYVTNITQRMQSEEELRQSEEKFRSLSQISPVGVFITDAEGKTTYWNNRLCEITGMSNEEGKGTRWVDSIHPDDKERVFDEWYKSAEARTNFRQDYRFVDQEGNVTWTIGQATPLKDSNDELIGFVGSITDITDLKQSEEELARTKTLLSETEKTGKIGGWFVDLETMTQTWTEETYRIHEVDKDFIPDVSKGINFYAPWARPIIEQAFNHTVETGEPFDLELEFITAKGNKIWVHTVGKAQQVDGVTKVVSGSFQDITEGKLAENAVITSEERYRSLLSILTSVIWVTDGEGQFVEPQLMFEEFTGQPWDKHKGWGWTNMIHPDDRDNVSELWSEAVKSKSTYRSDGRMMRANGKYCYFEAVATPIFDEQGSFKEWVGTLADTTERKKAEEELSKYYETLEETVKERTKDLEEQNKKLDDAMKVFVGREKKIGELERRLRALGGKV